MSERIENNNGSAITKQKVGVMGVVFMIYAMACSGAYGIEDMIPAAGPGMTVLMLCVIPFLWAVPNALVSAELGSAIPEEGGNYVWVKRAFGEFWCFQSAFGRILSNYIGVPAYPVLAGNYVGTMLGWNDTSIYLFKLLLIGIFCFLNFRGVQEVAKVGTILGFLIVAAFASVIIIGFANAQYNPIDPFVPPGQPMLYSAGTALAIGIWMYTGYESMGSMAGELENPQVIPKALIIVVPLILLTYIPTTLAGLAAVGNWESWGTHGLSYGDVASLAGKGWGVFFVSAAFCGMLSIYNSWLSVGPRYFLVLAKDNMAPKFMTKTNKQGVPIGGWLLMVICCVLFALLPFSALATLTVTAILFCTSIMMVGALKLRFSEPDLPRPFKVRLNNFWFGAMCMLVPITAVIALYLNGTDYFIFGLAILMLGPVLYFFIRRRLGGLTKQDPKANPQNPVTRMPFGDLKRMATLFFMLAAVAFVGYFFLPWYEGSWGPEYYAEAYGRPGVFGLFIKGILWAGIVNAVLGVICRILAGKYDRKDMQPSDVQGGDVGDECSHS